jgi:phosphate transport system permease protein
MTVQSTLPNDLTNPREVVRERSARTHARRQARSKIFLAGTGLALLIVLAAIYAILSQVIGNGVHFITWSFFTQAPEVPSLTSPNAVGGIVTGLVGTLVVVGIAVMISVPFGLLVSVAIYEYRNRFTAILRTGLAVFVGLPSILFGLFVSLLIFTLNLSPDGLYGAIALSLLMVPVVAINCEEALLSVPLTLSEAGSALGARRSRLMLRVIFPYARPRITTGIFLALARASGETAPVLLTIGLGTVTTWNPTQQTNTLTTLIYQFLQSPYPAQHLECWGIALVLITVVLVLNIVARVFQARAMKR